MFNTVSVKAAYRQVFCCGNEESPEVVLILGSCRVVPYVNYLNIVAGNRFQIRCIDPINYHWDEHGNEQDSIAALKALETDEHFLSLLESVTIFIHEGLSSYGILNTLKDQPVNIYQFGMAPAIDVSLANFHDVFLMFKDFMAMDPHYQNRILTDDDQKEIVDAGNAHIDRFCGICQRSSFPEFAQWFRDNYLKTRLFHSFNHVSSAFTVKMFQLMNEKFLKLSISESEWESIRSHDMFANISTPLCKYDVKWRPYSWPESIAE